MGLDSTFSWDAENIEKLKEGLSSRLISHGVLQGDFWIKIEGKDLRSVIEHLRTSDDFEFDTFIDLCGVDYLGQAPRFESVIHLYSSTKKHRIRIHCLVPDKSLTVPSLTSYWKGANWQEREAFDMYGIRYEGHPNLKRILTAPTEKGHPQRKDYALRGEREDEEEL